MGLGLLDVFRIERDDFARVSDIFSCVLIKGFVLFVYNLSFLVLNCISIVI